MYKFSLSFLVELSWNTYLFGIERGHGPHHSG